MQGGFHAVLKEIVKDLSAVTLEEVITKLKSLEINSKTRLRKMVEFLVDEGYRQTYDWQRALFATVCSRLCNVTGAPKDGEKNKWCPPCTFKQLLDVKLDRLLNKLLPENTALPNDSDQKNSVGQMMLAHGDGDLLMAFMAVKFVSQLVALYVIKRAVLDQWIQGLLETKDPAALDYVAEFLPAVSDIFATAKGQAVLKSYTEQLQSFQHSTVKHLATLKDFASPMEERASRLLGLLTTENVEETVEKLAAVPPKTERAVRSLVKLVFEKMIFSSKSKKFYARFCQRLFPKFKCVPSSSGENMVSFQSALIDHCEHVVISWAKDEGIEHLSHIAISRQREICLGTAWFMCELTKLRVMRKQVMEDCLRDLVETGDRDCITCVHHIEEELSWLHTKVKSIDSQTDVSSKTTKTDEESKEKKIFNQEFCSMTATVRSLLDALTSDSMLTIVQQLHSLNVRTERHMRAIADLVVDRAVSAETSLKLMAKFCLYLLPGFKSIHMISQAGNRKVTFHQTFTERCRQEFYIWHRVDCRGPEEKTKTAVDEVTAKRRCLNTTRFLGELVKIRAVRRTILEDFLDGLLQTDDEEAVECVHQVQQRCKQQLTLPDVKAKVASQRTPPEHGIPPAMHSRHIGESENGRKSEWTEGNHVGAHIHDFVDRDEVIFQRSLSGPESVPDTSIGNTADPNQILVTAVPRRPKVPAVYLTQQQPHHMMQILLPVRPIGQIHQHAHEDETYSDQSAPVTNHSHSVIDDVEKSEHTDRQAFHGKYQNHSHSSMDDLDDDVRVQEIEEPVLQSNGNNQSEPWETKKDQQRSSESADTTEDVVPEALHMPANRKKILPMDQHDQKKKSSGKSAIDVQIIPEEFNPEDIIEIPDLQYDTGQWSPKNPDGRRWYSREFLFNCRFLPSSVTKLEDMLDIPGVTFNKPIYKPGPKTASRWELLDKVPSDRFKVKKNMEARLLEDAKNSEDEEFMERTTTDKSPDEEKKRKRREMMAEFTKYRQQCQQNFISRKPQRLELRNGVDTDEVSFMKDEVPEEAVVELLSVEEDKTEIHVLREINGQNNKNTRGQTKEQKNQDLHGNRDKGYFLRSTEDTCRQETERSSEMLSSPSSSDRKLNEVVDRVCAEYPNQNPDMMSLPGPTTSPTDYDYISEKDIRHPNQSESNVVLENTSTHTRDYRRIAGSFVQSGHTEICPEEESMVTASVEESDESDSIYYSDQNLNFDEHSESQISVLPLDSERLLASLSDSKPGNMVQSKEDVLPVPKKMGDKSRKPGKNKREKRELEWTDIPPREDLGCALEPEIPSGIQTSASYDDYAGYSFFMGDITQELDVDCRQGPEEKLG